jgi:hypothetical protein
MRGNTYTGVWAFIDRLNNRQRARVRKAERARAREQELAAAKQRAQRTAAAFDRKIIEFRRKRGAA